MTDTHSEEAIIIGELARTTTPDCVLRSHTFENCGIYGPAVLLWAKGGKIDRCSFPPFDIDAWLWVQPHHRVTGVVVIEDCTFENCRFENVVWMGPQSFVDALKASIGH